MSGVRTFIAVELDGPMRDALAALQEHVRRELGPPMRWVKPEGMHLTLKFLGQTPEDLLPSIADALAAAARRSRPFAIELGESGGFPTRTVPASSGPPCAATSTRWRTSGRTSRR